MQSVFDSVVRAEPAFLPRRILEFPCVRFDPAPDPATVLSLPVKEAEDRVLHPMAVLSEPVAKACELYPRAVLFEPVSTVDKLLYPMAVLPVPDVQELSALLPTAVSSSEVA